MIHLLVPGLVVLAAFEASPFLDQRVKLSVIPLPPRVQIAGAAVVMGVVGGTIAYVSQDVRSVPLPIGIAVLWTLTVPAVHLGNLVRDRVSPGWRR